MKATQVPVSVVTVPSRHGSQPLSAGAVLAKDVGEPGVAGQLTEPSLTSRTATRGCVMLTAALSFSSNNFLVALATLTTPAEAVPGVHSGIGSDPGGGLRLHVVSLLSITRLSGSSVA